MSTPVEVFEHETIHVGRPLRSPTGAAVRLSDAQFDRLVRFNGEHGDRFFVVGHRRLTATEHVGYVEVDGLAIEILPKADRQGDASASSHAWRDGLLEMIAVATGLRLRTPSAASQHTRRTSLLELVAARFVEEVLVLVHQGLVRGYRDEEQNGPAFRGRLLVAQHLRANVARDDRFYVRTQTYDRDTTLHRILAAALDEVAAVCASEAVAARAAECRGSFADVGRVQVTTALFERLRLGRATLRYDAALTLARLILEQRSPALRAGGSRVFALLFDMNVLWELYVGAMFRRAARTLPLEVRTQERLPFWRGGGHHRGVRPDIVVRSTNDRAALLVADTKWKMLRGGAPADADLKQMFVYNELLGAPRAALLYPGGGRHADDGRGEYVGRAHGCDVVELTPVAEGRWCGAAMVAQVAAVLASVNAPSAERHCV